MGELRRDTQQVIPLLPNRHHQSLNNPALTAQEARTHHSLVPALRLQLVAFFTGEGENEHGHLIFVWVLTSNSLLEQGGARGIVVGPVRHQLHVHAQRVQIIVHLVQQWKTCTDLDVYKSDRVSGVNLSPDIIMHGTREEKRREVT